MPTINPNFAEEIKKFGAKDFNLCFNCGNCTAICSLSTNDETFPRELIRYSTLGLEDDLKSSLKPWLCYYCGECSTDCPRQANPGELMMSLRRWLTAQYDWTGLSGLLYKNLWSYILAMIAIFGAVVGISYFSEFTHSELMHIGHLFEMVAIAGVFAIILLPNIIRMWYFTIVKPGIKVNLKAYFLSLKDLFIHMFTQKRFLGCEPTRENKMRWLLHLILVIGYLSLLFTTVFLNWFSTTGNFIVWLGYIESAAIFLITILFMQKRMRKVDAMHKHSQPSDWFFVIWLFLMGFTAFMVRLLIDTQQINSFFWVYVIHITVLAQWALIIVPFGKWTHFLYRSFAMYFDALIMTKEKK